MSRLSHYREAERALREQLQRLDQMKADNSLQREIEFEEKLRALMAEHHIELASLIAILDPDAARSHPLALQGTRKRPPRVTKRYRHPKTDQVIETKGTNHSLLKRWKQEHGAETVESWRFA